MLFAIFALVKCDQINEGSQNVTSRGERIVYGLTAAPNQFSHHVLVIVNADLRSNGALINNLWVLVHANIARRFERHAYMYMGSNNRETMPVVRYSIQVVWPPTFDQATFRDAISLVRMNTPVQFSANLNPIALPSGQQRTNLYMNTVLRVSGFGEDKSGAEARELQFTDVISTSDANCRAMYGQIFPFNGFSPSIFCMRGYPNALQGLCGNDATAPLITREQNPVLVGFGLFLNRPLCSDKPTGYLRVGPYVDWINTWIGNSHGNY